MADFNKINVKTGRTIKTFEKVESITSIPNGYQRVNFKNGSCKVSASYILQKIEKNEAK